MGTGGVASDVYETDTHKDYCERMGMNEKTIEYDLGIILSMVKSSTESRGFQLDNVRGIAVPEGRFRFIYYFWNEILKGESI